MCVCRKLAPIPRLCHRLRTRHLRRVPVCRSRPVTLRLAISLRPAPALDRGAVAGLLRPATVGITVAARRRLGLDRPVVVALRAAPIPRRRPISQRTPAGFPAVPLARLTRAAPVPGRAISTVSSASSTRPTRGTKRRLAIPASPSWGFTLPQGQCTPFSWGKGAAFKVDPCSSPWIAVFRNLMMYLFYGLASFYIWRSITASTPGAK